MTTEELADQAVLAEPAVSAEAAVSADRAVRAVPAVGAVSAVLSRDMGCFLYQKPRDIKCVSFTHLTTPTISSVML